LKKNPNQIRENTVNSVGIAIKMETDAISFYEEGAQKTRNPVGKKMFLSIAADERRHLDMLTAIFKGLDIEITEARPIEAVKTIFGEMKEAMMKRAEATADEQEAFKIAMEMEKKGMEFYTKAMSQTPSDKEQRLFQQLAKEEQEHYAVFSQTYSFLNETGNWFLWEEKGIIEG
jgi:rubrerythrin